MSAAFIDFLNKDNVNIVYITSNDTYSKPANLHKAYVILTGGGGSGANILGEAAATKVSGGGGGAATVMKFFNEADLGANETVTIGGVATASTFGALLTAAGGTTAPQVGLGSSNSTGGANGTAAGGDLNIDGGYGNPGVPVSLSGHGGGTYWGPGARSSIADANGNDATVYGTGGSGALGVNVNRSGGAGASGVCVIIEFLNP